MATKLHLTPEFQEAVQSARKVMAETGEWPSKDSVPPFAPIWEPEVAEVFLAWNREGSYAAEIAKIGAEDPDLADQ